MSRFGSRDLRSGRGLGPRPSRRGFTLIELLVVVSLIGVLVAVLLPALERARNAADRAMCASNLRQVGVAMSSYATDRDGWFPHRTTGIDRLADPAHKNGRLRDFIREGYAEIQVLDCPGNGTGLHQGTPYWVRPDMNGDGVIGDGFPDQFGGTGDYVFRGTGATDTYAKSRWSSPGQYKYLFPIREAMVREPNEWIMAHDVVNVSTAHSNPAAGPGYNYSPPEMFNNHDPGAPAGGNISYTDGHVEWAAAKQTATLISNWGGTAYTHGKWWAPRWGAAAYRPTDHLWYSRKKTAWISSETDARTGYANQPERLAVPAYTDPWRYHDK